MQSPSRCERRYAASVRVLAACVTCAAAWLVVVAQLATALHFALISHRICAEHGELEHGSASVQRPVVVRHGNVITTGGIASDHDHCPLLSRRIERAALLHTPGVRVPDVPFTLASAIVHANGRVPTRGELLLSAPKQSPPV